MDKKDANEEAEELIQNLYYQYLKQRNLYLVNEIRDSFMMELCKSYGKEPKSGEEMVRWFLTWNEKVTAVSEKLKLAFATLLTMGSNPFRFMRGVLMKENEQEEFHKLLLLFGYNSLLSDEIELAACHGDLHVPIEVVPVRPLNFRNYGIYVNPGDSSLQMQVIAKGIHYAKSHDAEIMIFPELSIGEDRIFNMIEMLELLPTNLKLVVGGSYYRQTEDGYVNSAPILARDGSGKWGIVAHYEKMMPFSMGYNEKMAQIYHIDTKQMSPSEYDLLMEDISLAKPHLTLLPATDGIIGIATCRDAMDLLEQHNPLHRYCDFIDLLLVISYNNGDSSTFVSEAECLARWHNCATLYMNAVVEAKAEDNKLEISFAVYPQKRRDKPHFGFRGYFLYKKPI